jgi:hypothetical protein
MFGEEVLTVPSNEFEMSLITDQEEDPDQCYISAHSVKRTAWEQRGQTGYFQNHPTHWLAKHGVEVDAGDHI